MSRSLKKGFWIDEKLFKKVKAVDITREKKIIKTWARRSGIPPDFVGHMIAVHDGHKHVPIYITENMVGFKLGDFVPTRIFRAHGGRKAKAEKRGGKGR